MLLAASETLGFLRIRRRILRAGLRCICRIRIGPAFGARLETLDLILQILDGIRCHRVLRVRQRLDHLAQLRFGAFHIPQKRFVARRGGQPHVELERAHLVEKLGGALDLRVAVALGLAVIVRAGASQAPAQHECDRRDQHRESNPRAHAHAMRLRRGSRLILPERILRDRTVRAVIRARRDAGPRGIGLNACLRRGEARRIGEAQGRIDRFRLPQLRKGVAVAALAIEHLCI